MTQMSKYCVLTFDEMSLKTSYHKAQLTEKGDFGGLKCRNGKFVRFYSAVYAMMLSVRLSVRLSVLLHIPVFCRDE